MVGSRGTRDPQSSREAGSHMPPPTALAGTQGQAGGRGAQVSSPLVASGIPTPSCVPALSLPCPEPQLSIYILVPEEHTPGPACQAHTKPYGGEVCVSASPSVRSLGFETQGARSTAWPFPGAGPINQASYLHLTQQRVGCRNLPQSSLRTSLQAPGEGATGASQQ